MSKKNFIGRVFNFSSYFPLKHLAARVPRQKHAGSFGLFNLFFPFLPPADVQLCSHAYPTGSHPMTRSGETLCQCYIAVCWHVAFYLLLGFFFAFFLISSPYEGIVVWHIILIVSARSTFWHMFHSHWTTFQIQPQISIHLLRIFIFWSSFLCIFIILSPIAEYNMLIFTSFLPYRSWCSPFVLLSSPIQSQVSICPKIVKNTPIKLKI